MSKEKSNPPLTTRRHSAAHVLAQAILEKFPGASLAIGPDIDNGFYYDVITDPPIKEEDLSELEKIMKRIVKEKQKFIRYTLPLKDALEYLNAQKQTFKIEMAKDLGKKGEAEISFYRNVQGKDETERFVDMCSGPHVDNTGEIGSFKLHAVSGAYWRGDSNNPQLQRVYGYLFDTPEELKEYIRVLEEAKKRDHRKIGEDLHLFSLQEHAGGGLVFWHPRGAKIRREIEKYWYFMHEKAGYEFLYTPHIANLDLWKTSGHTDFYIDSMFQAMEDENLQFQLKPMNCPFHILIYKDTLHSYREFPIRWAEMGTVYRREMSGALHGLMRVRGFTQDDAHIFLRDDQIEEEVVRILDFIMEVLGTFGFSNFEINLSTRPEESVGTDDIWDLATSALRDALEKKGFSYEVDEGGGAFYGPKIDIKIEDAIGRKWQCSTIQLDFNLPGRFQMEYVTESNERKQPIMIHRALLGSVERFFGILIEHYVGAFPLWLAPEQVRVLPVSDHYFDYAQEIRDEMFRRGFRAEADFTDETLGKKIRNAEKMKVPYMIVVGEKEKSDRTVNVRNYFTGEQSLHAPEEFYDLLWEEVESRRIQEMVKRDKK